MKKLTLFLAILSILQTGFSQYPSWSVNPNNFDYNGSITGQVFVNFEPGSFGRIAAFYGNECRGVDSYTSYNGICSITCYSNVTSGETLTFKYYDPTTDSIYDLTETVEFISNMVIGNESNPMLFELFFDHIILDPVGKYVSFLAGTYTIIVKSNLSWTVDESCDWLDCSPINGNNDGSFTITYAENTSPGPRNCDIILSDGIISETHTIEQAWAGDPFLTITPANYDYDTVLMETCSDYIPFVVNNIGGGIATGYYNISNFLQFHVSQPTGSFSIDPGDSLTVYVAYCPVSLDGTGTTLSFTGSGITNTVNAHLRGWTYCRKIIPIANPPEGGTTSPQTLFIHDLYYGCVDAVANPGYEFVNWEHEGIEVSTDPHYCADYYGACTLEPHILMANFQAIPQPHIILIPPTYDFGEVSVDDFATYTFELNNDGSATATGIIEEENMYSCIVFDISLSNLIFSLEPGESLFFDIHFGPFESIYYSCNYIIEGYGECNSTSISVFGQGVNPPNTVTTMAASGGGTTTGDGVYDAGAEVCINAFPDAGYIFDSWEELPWDCSGEIFTPDYCFYTAWWGGTDYLWIANILQFEFQLKVNLSGSFNGVDMNTYPDPGSFPLNQPYSTSPWNYGGEESIASLPNNDIVDWLLIELRNPPGSVSTALESTRIGRQAAFLLKDGSIVGLDGSSNLFFEIESSTNFHVVIWHRNHIGIISANPLIGVTNMCKHVFSYDFTDDSNKAFGGELAHKEVAPGIWGMIGADADANGIVDELDKNAWSLIVGKSGYLNGDFNLNGEVENMDKNDVWVPSQGYSSQIPFTGPFICGDPLFDDRDGKNYNTVQIGSQCWMAENLNYGNMTDNANDQQNTGTIEKYCFNNDEDSCTIYGAIYQWDELMDYQTIEGSQGICPDGWYVPTDNDWCTLENEIDVGSVSCSSENWRGNDAGANLKATGLRYWNSPNTSATNTSGFSAKGSGYYSFNDFAILGLGDFSQYWTSSTESSSNQPWMRGLRNDRIDIRRIHQSQDYGLSLRCIKE